MYRRTEEGTKLDRKQDLNVFYQICVLRVGRKNKMATMASNWLRHSRLLWNSRTQFNKAWLEARSQGSLTSLDLFFLPIGKTKMAALASDWLRNFRLLLWNRWTEFNETWQEAISQRPLPSFRADRINKMTALDSDQLRPFWLLWNCWMKFNETWQKASCQRAPSSLGFVCFFFFGRSENQDDRPGFWLAEPYLTSSLKLLNRIQRNLKGSKILTSSTKFVFFGPSGKQDGRPASDWLRHYRPLLWNRWTEFNETWQEARSQRPVPRFFRANRKYMIAAPASYLLGHYRLLHRSMKPLNGIQRNLTGRKISTSSTKFVFSGRWENRLPPESLIRWHIFDFSSKTAERNSTEVDRKQDINVSYLVGVFRTDQ